MLNSDILYQATFGPIIFLIFTIYSCTEHNRSVFLVFQVFIAVCKRNCDYFMLDFFRVEKQLSSNNPRIPKNGKSETNKTLRKYSQTVFQCNSHSNTSPILAWYIVIFQHNCKDLVRSHTHPSILLARPFLFSVPVTGKLNRKSRICKFLNQDFAELRKLKIL